MFAITSPFISLLEKKSVMSSVPTMPIVCDILNMSEIPMSKNISNL